MKGNIKNYEKEIITFFKTKDLDVEIINKEFNSFSYKSEQCSVDIVLKTLDTIKNISNINPNMIHSIASFSLIAMPGCCGVVISTGCRTLHKLQGCGIGQFLHQLRLKIAKDWGYSILMCTDVDSNTKQKHILKKHGWNQIQQFTNKRTSNLINVHTINLNGNL